MNPIDTGTGLLETPVRCLEGVAALPAPRSNDRRVANFRAVAKYNRKERFPRSVRGSLYEFGLLIRREEQFMRTIDEVMEKFQVSRPAFLEIRTTTYDKWSQQRRKEEGDGPLSGFFLQYEKKRCKPANGLISSTATTLSGSHSRWFTLTGHSTQNQQERSL